MIRPLRQRHRRMFVVIGILLPMAFVGGIAARKVVPGMKSLPAGISASPPQFSAVQWEPDDLFAKTSIQVRLLRENGGSGHLAIQFSAPNDFLKPDLIVYWVAGIPKISDMLPDDARLLGAFNAEALQLPDDAGTTNGVLVLYSLANGEVIDVSKILHVAESTK